MTLPNDQKLTCRVVESGERRLVALTTTDDRTADRTPVMRPLYTLASWWRLWSIGHGYLGSEGLTGGGPAPDRISSWVHRAHRFHRVLTFFFMLCSPILAQASLGSWVKGVLHLGKYHETVATEVATLSEGHGTWGLAFSPHGHYLAASSPQTAFVQLWDWRKDRVVRRFRRSGSDISVTTPLAISPHGRLLASCQSDAYTIIQVWNVHTGAVVASIPDLPHSGGCAALAFSPQGHSLIWIRGWIGKPPPNPRQFFVYSTRTWAQRWALPTRPFIPNALAVSARGHWAVIGGGRYGFVGKVGVTKVRMVLINLRTRQIARTIRMSLPLSPPRHIGNMIERLGPGMPQAVACGPRAHTVVMGFHGALGVGLDNVIRLYDTRTGALVGGESGPITTWVTALRYTPQGRYLIEAGIHHEVEIWDGSHHHLLQKIPHQAWSLAVSPHGHYLALGEGGQIQVWRFR